MADSPVLPPVDARDFRMTWYDILGELGAVAGLVLCVVLVASAYGELPASIAMHFDIHGNPNRYGSKAELWFIVGTAAFTFFSLEVPARIVGVLRRARSQPWARLGIRQLRLMRTLLLWCNLETMALMAWICHVTIRIARGELTTLPAAPLWGATGLMGLTFLLWLVAAAVSGIRQFGGLARRGA